MPTSTPQQIPHDIITYPPGLETSIRAQDSSFTAPPSELFPRPRRGGRQQLLAQSSQPHRTLFPCAELRQPPPPPPVRASSLHPGLQHLVSFSKDSCLEITDKLSQSCDSALCAVPASLYHRVMTTRAHTDSPRLRAAINDPRRQSPLRASRHQGASGFFLGVSCSPCTNTTNAPGIMKSIRCLGLSRQHR